MSANQVLTSSRPVMKANPIQRLSQSVYKRGRRVPELRIRLAAIQTRVAEIFFDKSWRDLWRYPQPVRFRQLQVSINQQDPAGHTKHSMGTSGRRSQESNDLVEAQVFTPNQIPLVFWTLVHRQQMSFDHVVHKNVIPDGVAIARNETPLAVEKPRKDIRKDIARVEHPRAVNSRRINGNDIQPFRLEFRDDWLACFLGLLVSRTKLVRQWTSLVDWTSRFS